MNRIIAIALLSFATIAAACAQGNVASGQAQVELFSPQGYMKKVRQVVARFTLPMVALGDPRLEDPFTIDCTAAGNGRWADDRNWVYDFEQDVPGGVSCRFSLKSGAQSLSGARINGTQVFAFNTGGPTIVASLPYEGWQQIDEDQIFLLKLDAPASVDSIRTNTHCIVEGIAEAIPVEVLTGAERIQVLQQRKSLGFDYLRLFWKRGEQSDVRIRNRALERDEELVTVLRCQRRLPPATRVQLHWAAGVATPSGIATQVDQTLAFRVRSAFTAQVECTRTNARSGCTPVQPINVNFSAPVPRAQALAIRLKATNGAAFVPKTSEPENVPFVSGVAFTGPFPDASTLKVSLPQPFVDDAGRALENAARFPLEIRLDGYPPLVKFSADFGVLESKEGGVLPVTLRNVEANLSALRADIPARMLRLDEDPRAIADWLRRVEKTGAASGEWVYMQDDPSSSDDTLKPKLQDIEEDANIDTDSGDDDRPRQVWKEKTGTSSMFGAGDKTTSFKIAKSSAPLPAEVVGIPLRDPGFYVVELESRALGAALLGRDEIRYVATSALVTNLSVHFKWGRESSRVWVTRLSDGTTVADAEVVVADYCSGASLWQGRSDQDGIAAVDQSFGDPHEGSGCTSYSRPPLMILAKTADDFSFTLSNWAQGISPHQFAVPVGSGYSRGMTHTVLDRALFRAGETVSMKHFLREHVLDGVAVPSSVAKDHAVRIAHQGSGETYSLTASFDGDGVAENQWKIPDEAKSGTYTIAIDNKTSGQFKVEQFRLPSMRGRVSGPAKPLVRPKEVDLDLHVAYLSGGGASGLEVKLRTLVEPKPIRFPGYDDFQFGGAPVTEGISAGAGGSLDFDFESDSAVEPTRTRITPVTLDGSGAARVTVDNLPALSGPAQLTAEIEYADANGEILTTTGQVRLVPSVVSLGIRREGWVASPDQIRFRVVAVDLDGKPKPQQPIVVSLYQSTSYSYRKRLIGGFYAYETTREVKKLKSTCKGVTDAQGLLACEVAPGASGQILVRAETDAEGALAGATASVWAVGKDDWWFGGTSGDRMDVLPEKKEYEAGDTARFQVRMPFRSATALVTVEREGVLTSFVTHLKGNAPILEVPITDRYSPNIYVSVLAIRGRVARAEEGVRKAGSKAVTALVDLNKPAYRMGVAQIKVGWKPHRLDVTVQPGQRAYKVRDKASVRVHVATADGKPLPSGTEVAIAAVDEALLELAQNPSWNLLDAMMGTRGLEVWTSTAQMQVVGKRHYGRKAVPHGGGGGRELHRARELFDSLLLWSSRVKVDENGDAAVTIPLNDSLSSFRIVAVAHGGAQLFGTGAASINTTQEVILVSGLPPLVREGDRYSATFTVRNTTDRPLAIHAQAVVTPKSGAAPAPLQIEVPAGQSRDLAWQVQAPVNAARVTWDVTATTADGSATDHLKITESVIPAYPVRTYQATISQLTAPLTIPAESPKGSIPGRGGLEVNLQTKLGGSLDGVREYMSLYPYVCLEQLISRAVVLRDRGDWDALMARLPAYMDRDGLLKYFATDRLDGDDALTAYVLAIAHESEWPILSADRDRLVQALTHFVNGKLVRSSALPTADLAIRKLAAIEALSRYGIANAGMLDSITIEPNRWPTSAVLDWIGILRRVSGIEDAQEKSRAALGALRARLNFQGTTMGFSTERQDALWWLMISADSNANRMLLTVLDRPEWHEDIPRLVRGALGRQQSGHWNTTVANAWGVLAMEKFSAAFESVQVAGATAIRYGTTERSIAWPRDNGAADVSIKWGKDRGQLEVTHVGMGAPWALIRATAALPLDKPLSTGFTVRRTVTAVEQSQPGVWTRGDVARVHLELEAQSDMSWVVVDDPIPAGATILGSGLGGQSALLTRDDRRTGFARLAFEERRFDAFRAYYRFVPKGRWSVEYTVRFNNPGTFQMPATRVEAMYAPEMLGEIPNATMVVTARP